MARLEPKTCPPTAGAMSPDPLTVKVSSSFSSPPREVSTGSPPTCSPLQVPSGGIPSRMRWSKTAVAWLGWPVASRPKSWSSTSLAGGEVTNRPTCAVEGRSARRTTSTRLQFVPSVDSSPVTVSPERVRRSQRGESAET
jgi:hypothetical protein